MFWKMLAGVVVFTLAAPILAELPPPNHHGHEQPGSGAVTPQQAEEAVIRAARSWSLTRQQAFDIAFGSRLNNKREINGTPISFSHRELIVERGRIILLSQGYEYGTGCEICTGYLAVHYLNRNAGRWAVEAEWLKSIPIQRVKGVSAGWGTDYRMLSVPVINANLVRYSDRCEYNHTTLYALTDLGPQQIADFPAGTIAGSPRTKPIDYRQIWGVISRYRQNWEFVVHYSGWNLGQRTDQEVVFRWDGEHFAVTSDLPEFGSCA